MEPKFDLRKMEEIDARIEKVNYDLAGLENRKKEMEDNKLNKQKEIERLEKEKNGILGKTDSMKALQKFIYVVVSLRNDLKRVDLINTKISEYQKEKNNIQNKLDIQNNLYVETIKEKEKYIEERKALYVSKNENKESRQENSKMIQIETLMKIYEMMEPYKNNKKMQDLKQLIGKEINQYFDINERKNIKENEDEDEME